uniref:Uncharacterized protein n=1 Tax=Fagus sylvatica TaxID=28930 RepID=A0A2N9II57_FAGSY
MARHQHRARASKLARLVNTEERMAQFRQIYRIPPSIALEYHHGDNLPVLNWDEILLPIMAVVEGVNGLPDSNKGYDNEYLKVSGEWFTGGASCRNSFGFPDPSRTKVKKSQVNVKLVERVLATNVYVDRKNQPHSAPFLLRYESQIGSFLEDSDTPDLIPSVKCLRWCHPSTPSSLWARRLEAALLKPERAKEKVKGAGKKGKKPISQAIEPELITPSSADPEPLRPPTRETSPQFEAWVPDLMYGDGPISAKDTLLDNSEIEISAKEAHEADMKMWDSMHSGQIFRHLFRGLMLAAQGVHCMEARVFKMTKTLQTKDVEHEKNMAEVVEATKRARMEEEMAEMKENVRKLETECIHAIGKAREEGKEEVMGEVKAQFQLVYNNGFRDGWKSALKKTKVLAESELFLQANTPLPYLNAGLKDTDDEADNKDGGEEEEEEEELEELDNQSPESLPELTVETAGVPKVTPSS